MLKSSYDSLEAIPENARGAYIEKDGKWILDTFAEDHPLVKKRDELLSKLAAKSDEVETLTTERDTALRRVVPSGKKVVDPEVAKLGEAAQQASLTADDIPKIKGELDTLKAESEGRRAEETLSSAAAAAEITGVDAFKKLDAARKLKLEKASVNGEDKWQIVNDVEGKTVKVDFNREWLEKQDEFKPFLPALFAEGDMENGNGNGSGGIKFPEQKKSKKEDKGAGKFDNIRKNVEAQQKSTTNASDFANAFNRVPGGK